MLAQAHAPLTQSRETVTLELEELPAPVALLQKKVTILLGIIPMALERVGMSWGSLKRMNYYK